MRNVMYMKIPTSSQNIGSVFSNTKNNRRRCLKCIMNFEIRTFLFVHTITGVMPAHSDPPLTVSWLTIHVCYPSRFTDRWCWD